MRLSPKFVFLGIIAFGLPIALTTGWALGVPSAPPRPIVPAGAGVIGTAPSVVSSGPAGTVPVTPSSSPGGRTTRVRTDATVIVGPTSASPPVSSTTGATAGATVRPPRPTRTHRPPPVPTPTGTAGTSPPAPTTPPPTADPSASPGSRVRP